MSHCILFQQFSKYTKYGHFNLAIYCSAPLLIEKSYFPMYFSYCVDSHKNQHFNMSSMYIGRQHSVAFKSESSDASPRIQKLSLPLTKLQVTLGKLLTSSNLSFISYKCDHDNVHEIGLW